jgi:hypothetical protein
VIETPDSARVLDRTGTRALGDLQDGGGMQTIVLWRIVRQATR